MNAVVFSAARVAAVAAVAAWRDAANRPWWVHCERHGSWFGPFLTFRGARRTLARARRGICSGPHFVVRGGDRD